MFEKSEFSSEPWGEDLPKDLPPQGVFIYGQVISYNNNNNTMRVQEGRKVEQFADLP